MTRTRERIAPGIYRDAWGLAGTVKVGRIQKERRYPSDHPLDDIKNWQDRTRADLREQRADDKLLDDSPAPIGRTFADDLKRYLKTIDSRASFKSDRSHLRAWLPHVGHLKRSAITPAHISKAMTAWTAAGRSVRTLRHRRRVLRELWTGLDGARARPPLQGVTLPSAPAPAPMPLPHATILAVAKSLKKGKRHAKGYGDDSTLAYARFLVLATTGQRPAQVGRAERGDVDLKRRIWFVRPAKGGLMVPLPLDANMLTAWKTFIAAKAWGQFDSRSFSKTLRRHGWPANVRPYNLRHTFAIDHLLAGTPIGDLQGLLGHRQLETTRKFYAPVLLALLRRTVSRRKLKLA